MLRQDELVVLLRAQWVLSPLLLDEPDEPDEPVLSRMQGDS